MIDKETRQHEQARHPENNKDNMRGLEPDIEHCDGFRHWAALFGLSLADQSKQLFYMFNGRIGQDTVAEIENMRPVGKRTEYPLHGGI